LINRPNVAKIYCLMRSPSVYVALQTLLVPDYATEKVEIILGDVSKPLLGLSESAYETFVRTCPLDVIIHCAAEVNVMKPYKRLKIANVDGSHEVLRLASHFYQSNRYVSIHHISTSGVYYDYPSSQIAQANSFSDTCPIGSGTYAEGYRISKWVSEKVMRAARLKGIHVCIYRVGVLWGGQDGVCKNKQIK